MTCQIKLLGTSFTLKADEDPEYLKQVIWNLKKKVEEIQGSVTIHDPLKIAILAGLSLSDELLKLKNLENGQTPQADSIIEEERDRITLQWIDAIDQALTEE